MDTAPHQLQLHHHHHDNIYNPHQHILIQAVKDNNLKHVKELLKNGTNINARDKDGYTSLYWACCRGHVDICRCLLRPGCDVTAKCKTGTTALMACADNGQETCLQLLLQHKSIQLDDVSDRGDSALHMAAYRGVPSIVELLCMAGASLDLHNNNGKTPLAVAYIENNQECIKVLKLYEKSPTNTSSKSYSPLPSRQQWNSSPSPYTTRSDKSPNATRRENIDNMTCCSPAPGSTDDDHFMSSDSALGFSVHSPPSSSQFASPNSHHNHLDTALLLSSDKFDSRGSNIHSDQTNRNSGDSMNIQTSSGDFATHLHSPVEMDERPFFNSPVSIHDSSAQRNSQSYGSIYSGHHPDGPNALHSDMNTGGGMDSIGYYSSGVNGKYEAMKAVQPPDPIPMGGPCSHSMDQVFSKYSTHIASMADVSGPPSICYSLVSGNDDVKTIYSSAQLGVQEAPLASLSANKQKISINNLSSNNERNEGKINDTSQYNIVDTKSDTTQLCIPNINPAKMSFKNKTFKERSVQKINTSTNDSEVLPGLRMSSFLDTLQLKVVMLEDSLDKANTSKSDLLNENKRLKDENMELRVVIQKLTQQLSEFS